MLNVRAHTCYLGTTGYASHARSFFREFSKYVNLKIRNYTWDENPDYLDDLDFSLIDMITLLSDGKEKDFPVAHGYPTLPWKSGLEYSVPDVDIVLMEVNHKYFYDNYDAPVKIAYTVWESTELPQDFFEQLLKFDYLWVVSEWHKSMAILQGYPSHRIFIIHEGVDSDFFEDETPKILSDFNDNRFKFIFFGRWDYRKSVPEIIKTFIDTFDKSEPVDLILAADNPYPVDGLSSTEERLDYYGFNDERIKVKHFVPRKDYISYIKSGDVFLSCARSEGWNIPLIEAMAAGTPAIYSNWGAQLEFANDKGIPVSIKEERKASIGSELGFAKYAPGFYAEPDFNDLGKVMRDSFEKNEYYKKKANLEKYEIREKFSWPNVANSAHTELLKVCNFDIPQIYQDDAAIIMSHADSREKEILLKLSLISAKRQGYAVIISTHIPVHPEIHKIADYVIYDKENPVVYKNEYGFLSDTIPVHYIKYPEFELAYAFEFNHGYAALKLIKNGLAVANANNFKISHCVNYDYIINDPEIFQNHRDHLNTDDVVCYKWESDRSINSGFFSGKTDKILKSLTPFNSKSDYFAFPNVLILEDFLYEVFIREGMNIKLNDISEISSKNYLNSYKLQTFPVVKSKSGKESFLYLTKEERTSEYILCAVGTDEEPLKMEIEYKGKRAKVTADPKIKSISLFSIPDKMVECGFKINLLNQGERRIYNKNTSLATSKLNNREFMEDLIFEDPNFKININFNDGPFVEILGKGKDKFNVSFYDNESGKLIHHATLGYNTWTKANRKYYTDWRILITDKDGIKVHEENLSFKNRRVYISIDSSSLGDTIAWIPYVDEFRKKHNCEVFVSTFKNQLFRGNYPDLNFINPGESVENVYGVYKIGWFYKDGVYNKNLHPRDFKNIPMQSTATDILGLEYTEIKPKIVKPDMDISPIKEDYVTIGFHSTAQAKYWNNPTGWQELVDWFNSKGIKCVMISMEGDGYMGNNYPSGILHVKGGNTLENAIRYIKNSKMFIGISSGLSWLSWALDTPTVLISGFSSPFTEFGGEDVVRIFNEKTCNSCFNRINLDPSDWKWCPDHKDTERMFECTKSIKGQEVIKEIEKYLHTKNLISELDWGKTPEWHRKVIKKEIFDERIYEKLNEVEDGDIVVDFGASIGPFVKSILEKKPSKIFAFEPCLEEYEILVKNIKGQNITHLNLGISEENSDNISNNNLFSFGEEKQTTMKGITFKKFIDDFSIDRIDFLKTDCEGGEYSIFNEENFEWISKNVKKISGEWHLNEKLNPGTKEKFRKFRDLYLKRMPNHKIHSVDGVDIKWDLWNDHFIDFYTEVIICIDNTQVQNTETIQIEKIISESYDLGMVQNHMEILEASKFFKSLEVKNFMEIGTDQGGTFAIWSKLMGDKNGIRISVDLPHGPYGRDTYNLLKRDEYLSSLGSKFTAIHGSSHDKEIKDKVREILKGELLDFLFIDGDHTYEGVKLDYLMYKEFVKPNGWIGFHDIKDTKFHREANCRVDIFWNELSGEKIEFIDNSSDFGGIGLIKASESITGDL